MGVTHLRLATRQSKLALWQSEYVSDLFIKQQITSELVRRTTTGDAIQDRALHEIGGKGLFIKELEKALVNQEADAAVHSLKDLPAELIPPFELSAVLKRHAHCDAIIWNPSIAHRMPIKQVLGKRQMLQLGDLTIATGSLRRKALLSSVNPGITCIPIRGNVDTRINMLNSGFWDAIILAHASLERLQLNDLSYSLLDADWFTPCAGQGAIAIETIANHPAASTVKLLNHPETELAVTVERLMLKALGGDCTMPCGVLAQVEEKTLVTLQVVVLNHAGNEVRTIVKDDITSQHAADNLVKQAMGILHQQGLSIILADLKNPWHARKG